MNLDFYKSGWRPAIGWVCSLGLLYQFFLRPLLNGLLVIWQGVAAMPALDDSTLIALISGMIGFGGMRTYEKIKGKTE